MIQNFFTKLKDVLHEAADKLTGSDKRKLLARTAEAIEKGGQSLVAKYLIAMCHHADALLEEAKKQN